MKTKNGVMEVVLRRPYAIGEFVLIKMDLQVTLIFHNDHGLVAIAIEHKSTLYVDERLPEQINEDLDLKVLPQILNSFMDFTGYESEKINFRSIDNFVELRSTPVNDYMANINSFN